LNNSRPKRGLINVEGRAANVLFVVYDDSDAEYFYSKITELDNSKARMYQTLETQTNIMKSITSVVNDSLIKTEQKQNSLEDSYD